MLSSHMVVARRKNNLNTTPFTSNLYQIDFMGVGDCEYIAEQRCQATGFDTSAWHLTFR